MYFNSCMLYISVTSFYFRLKCHEMTFVVIRCYTNKTDLNWIKLGHLSQWAAALLFLKIIFLFMMICRLFKSVQDCKCTTGASPVSTFTTDDRHDYILSAVLQSVFVDRRGFWLVWLLPKMWATASTKSLWLPASLFTTVLSASTKLDITGCCWHRKRSSTSRQDVMRCGRVPPITVSLPPMVSSTTPTSPMAPHWIASPGRPL